MVSSKFSNLKWRFITGYAFYTFFLKKHNDFHTHKKFCLKLNHIYEKFNHIFFCPFWSTALSKMEVQQTKTYFISISKTLYLKK